MITGWEEYGDSFLLRTKKVSSFNTFITGNFLVAESYHMLTLEEASKLRLKL